MTVWNLRTMGASALLIAVLYVASGLTGVRAQDAAATALTIPSGWVLEPMGSGEGFATWKNGDASYVAGFRPYAGSADDLFRMSENTRVTVAGMIDKHFERLNRCSSAFDLMTIRVRGTNGVVMLGEQIQFLVAGVNVTARYDRPEASAANPDIEHILREACPEEVFFAPPPAGWHAEPMGIFFTWKPADKTTNAGDLMLSIAGATSLPSLETPLTPMLGPPHVEMLTSCGLPLRVAETSAANVHILVASSLYEKRAYTATYLATKGNEDPRIRQAMLNLCAKVPVAWREYLEQSRPAPFAATSPGPLLDIPVRLPHSFRSKTVVRNQPAGLPVLTWSQLLSGDATRTMSTQISGDVTTTTDFITTHDFIYELRDGVWYKRKTDILIAGGSYPDFPWRGTETKQPDATIAGVPVDVFNVNEGSRTFTVWIGKIDRYIRRYDEVTLPAFGRPATYASSDYDDLDRPVAIETPTAFVDATNCTTGIEPPRVLRQPTVTIPANGPALSKAVTAGIEVTVDRDGHLVKTRVADSTGFSVLDKTALTAVAAASFGPGTAYCTPATTSGLINILFNATTKAPTQ
jgi:TonB family protein